MNRRGLFGEDGNLWLKSKGGDWKRVVTE